MGQFTVKFLLESRRREFFHTLSLSHGSRVRIKRFPIIFFSAKMLSKFSLVFVAIFCITTICADVSHVVAARGGAAVDPNTINILKRNISNYLVHLDSDGGSQPMKLSHIYGATKQSVKSTIYTVQALLETSSGEKKRCEIRVLEEPLFDFCQMRITCENGGTYEVTMNQHGSHSHPFGLPDYVAPQTPYQPQQYKPAQQQKTQHGKRLTKSDTPTG